MMPTHPDAPRTVIESLMHEYTPHTFLETSATLSCHSVSGLSTSQVPAWGASEISRFQAEHLLDAGYRLIYDPVGAAHLLELGQRHGHTLGTEHRRPATETRPL